MRWMKGIPMHNTALSQNTKYPSSITEVIIKGAQTDTSFLIPVKEMFRVNSIFEKHEYAVSEHLLPTGPLTVVDIGANVGLFALYWKMARPDSTIYCFEPAANTYELLEKNIKQHSGVNLYPFGLGLKDEIAKMAIHPSNTGANSIKISAPNVPYLDVQIVQAMRAIRDIGLTYIDILKIDTEGCEVDILRSIQPRLEYVGIVMLEYHSEQDRRHIDEILSGFTLFGANASNIGCGTMKYVNLKLLE